MPQSQFPNARGTRINGADKENGRAGETGTPCQRTRRNCGARCKLQSHAGKISARARGVFSAYLARHSSSRAATILVRIGNGICEKPTPRWGSNPQRGHGRGEALEMRHERSDCRSRRPPHVRRSEQGGMRKARSASSGLSFHASFLSFTRGKPLAYQ